MKKQKLAKQVSIMEHFDLKGPIVSMGEYGSGHINATYVVEVNENGSLEKYIFQQVNTDIFVDIERLMENIQGVTSYLTKQIEARNGDPKRETLQVIKTKEGENFYRDADGLCYRVYRFITDATSYDVVESPKDFYESGVSFGNFQYLLADYPAETLYETIPDFHHTAKRFETFCQAVKKDVCGRAASVQKEIDFVMARAEETSAITSLLESKELPLRVTHNDTKLNNIMIDNATGKGICVIDLDTVMPGSALYDFGDSIRFGANTAVEDETDLSKVSLDLDLYEIYVKGYLEGCKGSLTELEVSLLPMGAKMMTFEVGMRFLTDYLEGDHYFRIHREHHNLDRCRTQFALVADMEKKWDEMKAIVDKFK